ncbi:PCDHD1 [Mytilus coruscus]|uniref:PCDHD1 n=1 Tax=Mytilus coruscus TaxID=42192 RepID=A0A6J8A433_MYTCO|nr:PCDHD1 [Mytilus coruscus]
MKKTVMKIILLETFLLASAIEKPVISVNTFSSDGKILILESSYVGTAVAALAVSYHTEVVCSIDNDNFTLSKLIAHTYLVKTHATLDREFVSSYVVGVACEDQQLRLSSSVSLNIYIADENDNSPEFQQKSYIYKVPENIPIGTYIFAAEANDQDIGKNGEIVYEIIPNHCGFIIDANTGEVMTSHYHDRESIAAVSFDVIAKDQGSPQRKSNASVTVELQDVNDNKPFFLYPFDDYQFLVSKNCGIGTLIGIVIAFDIDEGRNGQLTFSVKNPDLPFKITTSGEIRSTGDMNKDTRGLYYLTIEASDHGDYSLSSQINVKIVVTD